MPGWKIDYLELRHNSVPQISVEDNDCMHMRNPVKLGKVFLGTYSGVQRVNLDLQFVPVLLKLLMLNATYALVVLPVSNAARVHTSQEIQRGRR